MSDSRAEDEAAIQAVLVASYQAWAAGDADGMVADYTADATAIMTGSLRDGRDAIRQNMALAFAGPSRTPPPTTSSSAFASSAGTPRSSSANPASCSRRDRGSGCGEGERDLGFREEGRAVDDRRLPQQPGVGACTVRSERS